MNRQPAVYILASKINGALYAGVASDLVKRVWEHKNNFVEGFTKRYGVHNPVWYELRESMESAIQRTAPLRRGGLYALPFGKSYETAETETPRQNCITMAHEIQFCSYFIDNSDSSRSRTSGRAPWTSPITPRLERVYGFFPSTPRPSGDSGMINDC
jgi:putative endonuclease